MRSFCICWGLVLALSHGASGMAQKPTQVPLDTLFDQIRLVAEDGAGWEEEIQPGRNRRSIAVKSANRNALVFEETSQHVGSVGTHTTKTTMTIPWQAIKVVSSMKTEHLVDLARDRSIPVIQVSLFLRKPLQEKIERSHGEPYKPLVEDEPEIGKTDLFILFFKKREDANRFRDLVIQVAQRLKVKVEKSGS